MSHDSDRRKAVKLYVPEIEGMTVAQAALAYAEAGWYVLPISSGKHAGSLVGAGWPGTSSRDAGQIDAWWGRWPDAGIALHCGKSGALVFDVDLPQHMPALLVDHLAEHRPPFQSTRVDDMLRGHYAFALPQGVMLGNSRGNLRSDPQWGDVRGRNGIIVVQPTRRGAPKRYCWLRRGVLPELPQALGRALMPAPRRPLPEHVARRPTEYVAPRIRGLITKLEDAQPGERNTILFWVACRLGEMAAAGWLTEDAALNLAVDTAVALGLSEREATWTARSGLRTGNWVAA